MPNSTRPGWDEYFLNIAKAVAARGDCRRRQIGAILVDKSHRIVGTGYNGYPPGMESCLAGECPRGLLSYDEQPADAGYKESGCKAIHAEVNAIDWADAHNVPYSVMYLTDPPCVGCLPYVFDSGIKEVIWPKGRLDRIEMILYYTSLRKQELRA